MIFNAIGRARCSVLWPVWFYLFAPGTETTADVANEPLPIPIKAQVFHCFDGNLRIIPEAANHVYRVRRFGRDELGREP